MDKSVNREPCSITDGPQYDDGEMEQLVFWRTPTQFDELFDTQNYIVLSGIDNTNDINSTGE